MTALSLAAISLLFLLVGSEGRRFDASPKSNVVPLTQAASDTSITLTLALPSTDMDGLHAALMDVSDPSSAKYGQHLSKAEVEAFVAPTAESVKAVTNWLAQHNVTTEVASPAGDVLRIKVPVQTANTLLSANYSHFQETNSGATLLGTLSYTIPDDVEQYIKFIYPTTQFLPPVPKGQTMFEIVQPPKPTLSKKATPPANCTSEITPECLQDLYNIPNTTTTVPGNSLAVAAYLNEFATQADLQVFFQNFRPGVATPNFTVVSIDNGITSGTGSLEASLDIDYTLGLAPGVPTTFLSDGNNFADGFIDMASFLLNQTNVPLVLSVSYGFNESDFTGSQALAEQFCNTYAQLGARGTSVFFCSGDNGVYSFSFNSLCDATEFGPTFPSGCPYITSVGGTEGIPETSAPFSGGGFSNLFSRPSYQDTAVTAYLSALGTTNAGLFNTSGRGFPDVSAQSVNFIIRMAGEFEFVLGTSASTPTFASVVALLNDQLLSAGKSPLGFMNPLLYSQGSSALNDITTGSNPGCGKQGFPAEQGWDPVTGLGTPDYEKLLSLVMSVAAPRT